MRTPLLLVGVLVAAPALASCATNATETGADRTITVTAANDTCDLSRARADSGTLTFDITNAGSQVTEFYLYGEDGKRIVGEVENIGPSTSSKLTVDAPAGTYVTSCRPGMTGDGIRGTFSVASVEDQAPVSQQDQARVDDAEQAYDSYVQQQSTQLLTDAARFVRLYESGRDDAARAAYPVARTHWERIEPVAESFSDLDVATDLREADLEPGQKWTGWHRIEKDLWPARAKGYQPLTPAQRRFYGADLMRNLRTLDKRVQTLDLTVDQISNGSRGLLEEVATGKVTGEEEYWSHTDLYDFQANIDGARVGFEGVKAIVEANDPELARTLTERFAALQQLLDAQRLDGGEGFRPYTALSTAEVKELSDAVNALAEPLSQLTGAVLS